MKYITYILYSQQLNRYYTGSTILEVQERLDRHLLDFYGLSKYTHKAKDWKVYYQIECETLQQARQIEGHIKRMKSRKYIENLKRYPAISTNLLKRYREAQD